MNERVNELNGVPTVRCCLCIFKNLKKLEETFKGVSRDFQSNLQEIWVKYLQGTFNNFFVISKRFPRIQACTYFIFGLCTCTCTILMEVLGRHQWKAKIMKINKFLHLDAFLSLTILLKWLKPINYWFYIVDRELCHNL